VMPWAICWPFMFSTREAVITAPILFKGNKNTKMQGAQQSRSFICMFI
jgi:hypothetical protein